ncbi:hypothetical protein FOPG_08748 [Fusarium oxysporum f. sp. conglutinans race 2 54008]|uniref:Uncharacterized protein n=1 Tax=Fusarium oxysporum f. sp. conglutinans race 2 54008 TaxID=1089457 RepID=X0HJR2_FUSOX|nr:hypothetical protein FOPG_08748 [Fusarium oxysporum f. sp. conglutinans race 2 54008]
MPSKPLMEPAVWLGSVRIQPSQRLRLHRLNTLSS